MGTKEKIKILYSAPEAAKKVTVTGWASSNGRFFGNDEHMARWDGCTHQICECGNEMERGWTRCVNCRDKKLNKTYSNYQYKEWDGKTPLALYNSDTFFWDADCIEDYLEDNNLEPKDLKLVYCRPEYLSEIDTEQWVESLPEDGELPKEFNEKLNEFNAFIRKQNPVSWFPDKYRTEYKRKN